MKNHLFLHIVCRYEESVRNDIGVIRAPNTELDRTRAIDRLFRKLSFHALPQHSMRQKLQLDVLTLVHGIQTAKNLAGHAARYAWIISIDTMWFDAKEIDNPLVIQQ